jgi:hypothetical protein
MSFSNGKPSIKSNSRSCITKSQALVSTAFQDHITKQLNLNLSDLSSINNTLSNIETRTKPKKDEIKSKIDTRYIKSKQIF